MHDVTLYHYPLSRSLRVLFLLHETRVPFHVVRVDLLRGEGYRPAILAVNPSHAVPMLAFAQTPGGERRVMSESMAIARFVATEAHRAGLAPKLVPTTPDDDAFVVADWERWFAFVGTTMDQILWAFRIINDFRQAPEPERDLLSMYADKWNREVIPQLEERLGKCEFASPFGFSALDAMLAQTLNWSILYARGGLIDPLGPHAAAYLKRISSRPAFRKAVSDAKMFQVPFESDVDENGDIRADRDAGKMGRIVAML